MRPLYKNDIVRLAKDIKDIKDWSVYFLLYNNEVIYVGFSQTPYSRISTHVMNFNIDKYHILNFATREEAFKAERYYIETFKPIHNTAFNKDSVSREERIEMNTKFHETRQNMKVRRSRKTIQKLISDAEKEKLNTNAKSIKEGQKKEHIEQKLKEESNAKITAIEQEKRKADVFETSEKINIPINTYVKKNGVYYFNINSTILSVKIGTELIRFEGKTYCHPKKVFGKISELLS
jgi:hypothetical protein